MKSLAAIDASLVSVKIWHHLFSSGLEVMEDGIIGMWSHTPLFFSHSTWFCLPHLHTYTHTHTLSSLLFSPAAICRVSSAGWSWAIAGWLAAHEPGLPGCQIRRQSGGVKSMCVGRVVGPGIGSVAQHPGLVIVSNKPPSLEACCFMLGWCEKNFKYILKSSPYALKIHVLYVHIWDSFTHDVAWTDLNWVSWQHFGAVLKDLLLMDTPFKEC